MSEAPGGVTGLFVRLRRYAGEGARRVRVNV